MNVSFKRVKIEKIPENEVTSHLIMEPHRRQKIDNLMYDENGIFSKKIFGNFNKCDCEKLTEVGFCPHCNCRVIDYKNIPHFYISLPCLCPVSFLDVHLLEDALLTPEEVEMILNYKAFLYAHESDIFEVIEVTQEMDIDFYNDKYVHIGVDALRVAKIDEEWIRENTVDYLSISHTIYRPMIINGDSPFIIPINNLYSEIVFKINNVKEIGKFAKGRPFYMLDQYQMISKLYKTIIDKLFEELYEVDHSLLKSEIISHPISGAIRGVLINRHDAHEDVLVVGDIFVQTLFPYLFNKHRGNMAYINEEIVRRGIHALINRPPTINYASTMAMKPRIASVYPVGHTDGTNGCLLHNYKYCDENENKIGIFEVSGDIEKFGQGFEIDENGQYDGIDSIGLRCIGMNPIAMNGQNADTDGDVELSIALYSDNSIEESNSILPSRSYLNYANGSIRNHIIEDFIYAQGLSMEEGLEKYSSLPRDEYFDMNQKLSEDCWSKGRIPTVGDIAKFIKTKDESSIEPMQRMFNFFNNKEEFTNMISRKGKVFDEKQSQKFIQSVMSANNTDISEAGYFYKLLMASADDYRVISRSCSSSGVKYKREDITKEVFDYRIKMSWVNELKSYCRTNYVDFMNSIESYEEISVRTPLSCVHTHEYTDSKGKIKKGVCKRCAGALPSGTKNIGTFTTLMVTEHATQSALNSMNKGVKKNINEVLQVGYDGNPNTQEIFNWMNEIIQELSSDKVSARFYEIALLSRLRYLDEYPFVSSMKNSINYSDNIMGAFIFNPNNSNFEKLIRAGSFEDDSLKLQIAMNKYEINDI